MKKKKEKPDDIKLYSSIVRLKQLDDKLSKYVDNPETYVLGGMGNTLEEEIKDLEKQITDKYKTFTPLPGIIQYQYEKDVLDDKEIYDICTDFNGWDLLVEENLKNFRQMVKRLTKLTGPTGLVVKTKGINRFPVKNIRDWKKAKIQDKYDIDRPSRIILWNEYYAKPKYEVAYSNVVRSLIRASDADKGGLNDNASKLFALYNNDKIKIDDANKKAWKDLLEKAIKDDNLKEAAKQALETFNKENPQPKQGAENPKQEQGTQIELNKELFDAISNKASKEEIESLIAKGADVNAKDIDGNTPLMSAAANNASKDVVELLIAKGADVNAKDNDGWTPLIWAARHNTLEVVESLIAKGADVNATTNKQGWTPLMLVVGYDTSEEEVKEVVESLIAKGADVNAKDIDGNTPLMLAKKYKASKDVIELLEKEQDKPSVKNTEELINSKYVTDPDTWDEDQKNTADENGFGVMDITKEWNKQKQKLISDKNYKEIADKFVEYEFKYFNDISILNPANYQAAKEMYKVLSKSDKYKDNDYVLYTSAYFENQQLEAYKNFWPEVDATSETALYDTVVYPVLFKRILLNSKKNGSFINLINLYNKGIISIHDRNKELWQKQLKATIENSKDDDLKAAAKQALEKFNKENPTKASNPIKSKYVTDLDTWDKDQKNIADGNSFTVAEETKKWNEKGRKEFLISLKNADASIYEQLFKNYQVFELLRPENFVAAKEMYEVVSKSDTYKNKSDVQELGKYLKYDSYDEAYPDLFKHVMDADKDNGMLIKLVDAGIIFVDEANKEAFDKYKAEMLQRQTNKTPQEQYDELSKQYVSITLDSLDNCIKAKELGDKIIDLLTKYPNDIANSAKLLESFKEDIAKINNNIIVEQTINEILKNFGLKDEKDFENLNDQDYSKAFNKIQKDIDSEDTVQQIAARLYQLNHKAAICVPLIAAKAWKYYKSENDGYHCMQIVGKMYNAYIADQNNPMNIMRVANEYNIAMVYQGYREACEILRGHKDWKHKVDFAVKHLDTLIDKYDKKYNLADNKESFADLYNNIEGYYKDGKLSDKYNLETFKRLLPDVYNKFEKIVPDQDTREKLYDVFMQECTLTGNKVEPADVVKNGLFKIWLMGSGKENFTIKYCDAKQRNNFDNWFAGDNLTPMTDDHIKAALEYIETENQAYVNRVKQVKHLTAEDIKNLIDIVYMPLDVNKGPVNTRDTDLQQVRGYINKYNEFVEQYNTTKDSLGKVREEYNTTHTAENKEKLVNIYDELINLLNNKIELCNKVIEICAKYPDDTEFVDINDINQKIKKENEGLLKAFKEDRDKLDWHKQFEKNDQEIKGLKNKVGELRDASSVGYAPKYRYEDLLGLFNNQKDFVDQILNINEISDEDKGKLATAGSECVNTIPNIEEIIGNIDTNILAKNDEQTANYLKECLHDIASEYQKYRVQHQRLVQKYKSEPSQENKDELYDANQKYNIWINKYIVYLNMITDPKLGQVVSDNDRAWYKLQLTLCHKEQEKNKDIDKIIKVKSDKKGIFSKAVSKLTGLFKKGKGEGTIDVPPHSDKSGKMEKIFGWFAERKEQFKNLGKSALGSFLSSAAISAVATVGTAFVSTAGLGLAPAVVSLIGVILSVWIKYKSWAKQNPGKNFKDALRDGRFRLSLGRTALTVAGMIAGAAGAGQVVTDVFQVLAYISGVVGNIGESLMIQSAKGKLHDKETFVWMFLQVIAGAGGVVAGHWAGAELGEYLKNPIAELKNIFGSSDNSTEISKEATVKSTDEQANDPTKPTAEPTVDNKEINDKPEVKQEKDIVTKPNNVGEEAINNTGKTIKNNAVAGKDDDGWWSADKDAKVETGKEDAGKLTTDTKSVKGVDNKASGGEAAKQEIVNEQKIDTEPGEKVDEQTLQTKTPKKPDAPQYTEYAKTHAKEIAEKWYAGNTEELAKRVRMIEEANKTYNMSLDPHRVLMLNADAGGRTFDNTRFAGGGRSGGIHTIFTELWAKAHSIDMEKIKALKDMFNGGNIKDAMEAAQALDKLVGANNQIGEVDKFTNLTYMAGKTAFENEK